MHVHGENQKGIVTLHFIEVITPLLQYYNVCDTLANKPKTVIEYIR